MDQHETTLVRSPDVGFPRADRANDVDRQLDGLKSATIMIVDDESTTIDVLEAFLEGEGYSSFITTTDSRQALDLLRTQRPDALLLDLMMPNVGGLEILGSVRSDEALKYTPVIILTSSFDAETKLKALELGASDFLGKPVDPSELGLRLRNTLAAKAYQDRLAYYDGLTGLANRRLFIEQLDRYLRSAKGEQAQCTVLHITLDRFKQINDVLGHRAGDAVLKTVAERLETYLRPNDQLSRIGGDEFSISLRRIPVEQAVRVAKRVAAILAEPFRLDGQDLFLTASIGIAVFPSDGANVETLLENANVAMSHAKRAGGNRYQFYSKSLNAEFLERLNLENHLHKALEREQLFLQYQPKVDVRSGRIIGAEALMRWQHPELGLVPPDRFIPIAEESNLIEQLGEWAIWTACRQNRAWQTAGGSPIRMAVNVSSKQFRSGNLLETIRGALRASGLEGKHLVLELTESMIMEDPETTADTLREIKGMGLAVSVDDFGTGYSSLSVLKRFPVDELKIDRSFVNGIPTNADDCAIVTAIVRMAHALGLTLVAEGVETAEQLAFLEEQGCDQYQGYLFSKPLAAKDWAELFAREESDESLP